jgi:predicted AAA+ superfamily ATPase
MYVFRMVEAQINTTLRKKSVLVLGPRQTGKSSMVRHAIPVDRTFNLLDQSTFTTLSRRSPSLRESLRDADRVVAIDEILAEALTRNIGQYSRFLAQVATMATQTLNIEKLASDAQLALLGVPPYTQRDSNAGWQFEQFIGQELWAYRDYREREVSLTFWRSTDKHEVDFVLGDRVAIEAKHTAFATPRDLKGPVAIGAEDTRLRRILVSRDPVSRTMDRIEIMPYHEFLQQLWSDRL